MKQKLWNAISLALIFSMLFTSAALADNVQNDVVAGGNDTITVGGSTVINYRITSNNGDGQTGCNAADTSPAMITINTPAGVTVDTSGAPGNQATLTFTSCGINQSATFSSNAAGDYAITVSVSDSGAGTYNTNPATFTLHVSAPAVQDQTITVTTAAPASAFYGSTFNVAATGGGSGNPVVIASSGSCTGSGDNSVLITMTSGSGTCTVTYNQAGAPGYNAASQVSSNTTAQRANATINVTGYSVTYDGNSHTATGTATGLSGEDLSALFDLSGTTHTTAGTYIGDAWSFAGDANYSAANGTVDDSIGKASATVTLGALSFTYDGSAKATSATTVPAGLSVDITYNGSATAPTDAGDYAVVATINDPNYAGSTTGTLHIGKAAATCSVSGYTGTYDGAAHGATGTCSGVGGIDLSGSLNLGSSFSDAPGGSAHWTFSGGTNYNDQSGDVSIEISKANASCTVTGYAGMYDAAAHAATGSCTGVGGADLSAQLNLGASFTNVPGGMAHWTFAGGTNYNDQSGNVAIDISKADATILVNGYTGVYDGTAHGATGSATGVLNESLSGLDLGASFTNVPGGTANWTFTDVTGNYNDASGSAAIVLSKANAAIVVNGYSGVYDGTAHGATGTATGVLGESLGGLDLGASFTNVPGGTANWAFTDVTGNYNDASGSAAIVISKANATIVVNGYTGIYDGATHGATGAATGVLGESLSGLNLGATFTNVPGGTANWTFTDVTGNYNDASGSAAIVINKANASCTVTGYNVVFDNVQHTATGSCLGVTGETLAGLDLAGTTHTLVGDYTDTWTFTAATGNYNNTSGTVNDKINAWRFNGFFQPVDMGNVWNTVRNGSTVPLKFELFADATELTDSASVKSITSALVACTAGNEDAIETVATPTGGTALRYDATSGQFIFNWKTPTTANKCYRVTMEALDGSKIMALFKLK